MFFLLLLLQILQMSWSTMSIFQVETYKKRLINKWQPNKGTNKERYWKYLPEQSKIVQQKVKWTRFSWKQCQIGYWTVFREQLERFRRKMKVDLSPLDCWLSPLFGERKSISDQASNQPRNWTFTLEVWFLVFYFATAI